jgi:hypothetical protein
VCESDAKKYEKKMNGISILQIDMLLAHQSPSKRRTLQKLQQEFSITKWMDSLQD